MLKHLSKDKKQRKQQLALIIYNCRVYGVEVKQELLDEYNKLDKEQLSLLIHNCNVYGVKNEIKQKYIDELNSRNEK